MELMMTALCAHWQLCIAVPCHIFKFWAFIGIMFQVREPICASAERLDMM